MYQSQIWEVILDTFQKAWEMIIKLIEMSF